MSFDVLAAAGVLSLPTPPPRPRLRVPRAISSLYTRLHDLAVEIQTYAPYLYFLINESPDELAIKACESLPHCDLDVLTAEFETPNGTEVRQYFVPAGDVPPKYAYNLLQLQIFLTCLQPYPREAVSVQGACVNGLQSYGCCAPGA